jgi:hypothetical protein
MKPVNPWIGKRLMLAWETGANLGHIVPLAILAKQFLAEGCDCIVAARDLASAHIALQGTGIRLVQAPFWPEHLHIGNEDGQAGYLDILAMLGFADPGKLIPMMQAWDCLLDMIQPDVVIADHAPALLPLLNMRGIAALAIGNGFTLPPLVPEPFPPLWSERAPSLPAARLFANLTQALTSLGHRVPKDWQEAFATPERLVFSVPELDPYHGVRQEPLSLPPEPLPVCHEPPLVPRIFVYLGAELPGLNTVLQCLTMVDCEVECYLRGLNAQVLHFLAARSVMVHQTPPDLKERLPLASHVVSQGGTGMAHSALAAGRPHGIFALHGESRINATALMGLGAGQLFSEDMEAEILGPTLAAFLGDTQMAKDALRAGRAVHGRNQIGGATTVEGALRRLLNS